ncbi:hypothetical protein KJ068_02555 [bacterium]|nr:hypothetical protein [bacterium]
MPGTQTQKTLTFDKPIPLQTSNDAVEYMFPFRVVATSLIGTPEERNQTSHHKIRMGVSGTLYSCWQLRNSDLIKVLFEYGKRHVIQKLKDGALSGKEELMLHTENADTPCPFEPSRISEPEDASFVVDIGTKKLMQDQDLLQLASSIIDRRDNINALFHERHEEKLITIVEERDILQFFRDAASQEEFFYRLCALSNAATNLNISVLRKITGIEDTQLKSISLLESYLKQNNIYNETIINTFRNINKMRQSYPVHGDRVEGVLDAHRYFEIEYPVKDFSNAWRSLLLNYLGALQRMFGMMKDNSLGRN